MKTTIKAVAFVAIAAVSSAAMGQLTIVNSIPGSFIDISAAGNLVAGSQGDDLAIGVTIPGGFGNAVLPAGAAFASSNGRLTVPGSATFTNSALDPTSLAGYYPYWDDLHTGRFTASFPASGIYAAQVGNAYIVQWVAEFFSGSGSFTMQVQIFNAAGQAAHGGALAQYLYGAPTWATGSAGMDGASATIGVFGGPTDFDEWSFNSAGIVGGQTVLSIVPAPGAGAALALGGMAAFRRRRA